MTCAVSQSHPIEYVTSYEVMSEARFTSNKTKTDGKLKIIENICTLIKYLPSQATFT
jgi:hypothetical protein